MKKTREKFQILEVVAIGYYLRQKFPKLSSFALHAGRQNGAVLLEDHSALTLVSGAPSLVRRGASVSY